MSTYSFVKGLVLKSRESEELKKVHSMFKSHEIYKIPYNFAFEMQIYKVCHPIFERMIEPVLEETVKQFPAVFFRGRELTFMGLKPFLKGFIVS